MKKKKGPPKGTQNALGNTTKTWTTEEIIAALEKEKGLVYRAAQRIGCCSGTIYVRCREVPEIKQIIKKYRGLRCDLAESNLDDHLRKKAPWAIALVLKTLGRNRGYVERIEQRVGGDKSAPPITTSQAWDNFPIELKKQILDHLRSQKANTNAKINES